VNVLPDSGFIQAVHHGKRTSEEADQFVASIKANSDGEAPLFLSDGWSGYEEILKKLGFEMDKFTGNTFNVTAVPSNLNNEDVKEIIMGVISDLIHLTTNGMGAHVLCNHPEKSSKLTLGKIDQIRTKFYLRFQAIDKPGVLSKISGILGRHGIGINSVTQKVHGTQSFIPLIMLTDYTTERALRQALNKIQKLSIVKAKPVAIRMENLW